MESSCEKIAGNRETASPETVKTSSITAPTVTMSTTSTVKDESERCSQSSLSPETKKLTKKRRTSSSINDQEKNNELSNCHSSDENFEETNTCKNRGTSNCDDNKKCINANEVSSDVCQNNEITTRVESNDEQISLKVDSTLCESESSVDKTDPIKADSSRVTSYATKLSSMATSPVQMMSKDSSKEESGHNVSSLSSPATSSEAVNPCQSITTELTKSPTSVIVKAKSATATSTTTSATTTTTTTKLSLLSSESSIKTETTTTVHCELKQEDENKNDENVNRIVIKEEMRPNQMDEYDDDNINDLKKQELCSSDSTDSTAINDTKCNSIIALSSSSESSNGETVNIQKPVQTSPLLVDDLSKTVQKNTETSNFSTSYISKDNDKNTTNHENSNDYGDHQFNPEAIPIQKSSAIPTSTIMSITKGETTKTTLSATVEPAVEGISFGLDNILSKAKTLQSNLCIENSVSRFNPSSSMSSQQSTSTKNDIITMSTSPKDLDSLPLQKSGRWNTMHVRISWEILRQQKASQGDKSNTNSPPPLTITPSSRSFNLKSPTILPPSSSSAPASASSISLPTLNKNSHLPYDLIRPPATNIFGMQTPQSQSQQHQNQFQPQSHPHPHPHSQLPPLHLYHQQNRPQHSTPHSRSLEISSFSASLMNAASGGLNTRLPLDSNPWDHRSQFGPVSSASGHLPYPSFQAPLSSSSIYASGSSIPQSLALSSSSSTSSVSTPSITAPISSLGKINGNSIFGLPPRPGEMTSFSTSLYNAAVAAAGHGLNRPNLEAWNSPFAPGPGMSSIAAHNFIRSSLPGFPGFPHPHSNPHATHNNLGYPGSVPTSMSNNLFANLAPPQPSHSSASSISSSNIDSLMNTPGRPGSSIFPPIGREEHHPPVSNSSGCGSIPGSGSSSSSSTSTSWGGLKAEAEKSEFAKHRDGTSRNIPSRLKDEVRSDSHHHHQHRSSSNNSNSSSSNNNSKIVGSKPSSSLLNHNGDYESSHRREREKSSNSQKREHSRPSSVSSVSSGNKIMKTSSSAFNDNRSSHINESKAKDDRKESMNNYNKYFDRSHKHSSNSDRQTTSSSSVSNLPADFLNAERDWEYRCQLAGLTEPMVAGMMPYPVSLPREYQNALWDPLSQPFPSHFAEQERIFQRYNILNSSGGGAPLTEKLAKEGPFQSMLDKEARGKEMAAFPPGFDRCAQYPLPNLIPPPNAPSLASPYGGPSSLSHGPGNLGLGHALPPPPLPPLSQSHPHSHASSSYHHQLQQHHLNQTSPGQSTPSSSSVLMFPPNPYLNSLHSLSASAGSNVRTDLNNRTKSLSS
ncbi:uncharacterized protein LOC107367657 [Tetranychus urticae]|uniref:Uncharacterized protein n=1 Tax=Tetranychus urticae TaxID=32264 RepID=T1KVM8_TETUR|nr:uncharacterized protein LOC107367657 [Tetranychus urticae]